LVFGAIIGECVSCKVGWELYKSQTTNQTEKFLGNKFLHLGGDEMTLSILGEF